MGKDSALALASEGVEIYLSARGEARLLASAQEIAAATGTRVVPVVADHGTAEGRARLLAACPEPDILVITCSPPRFLQSYLEPEPEEWMSALTTTLIGPVELMRATVGGMAERGFGRVVNITSGAVKAPIDVLGLSNGARSGLTGFVAGVARQTRIASRNVTINNLLPGPFDTDRLRGSMAGPAQKSGQTIEALLESRRKLNPTQRFGSADEFGAFCAFLCSVQAGYLTGQNILLDGGAYPGTF